MKRILLFILFITLIESCKEESRKLNSKVENKSQDINTNVDTDSAIIKNKVTDSHDSSSKALFSKINSLSYNPQLIKFDHNNDTILVGKYGTRIHYKRNIFINETGESPKGNLILELIELKTTKDLALNRARTVSGNELIESGGAYFLNFKDKNGKNLKLKTNASINVEFPKYSRKAMRLFYGNKDSLGLMNWNPTSVEFKDNYDTSINCFSYDLKNMPMTCDTNIINKTLNSKLYDITNLRNLGWINCDRFINFEYKTNLSFFIENKEIHTAQVYLIFKKLNSVMENHCFKKNGILIHRIFKKIPVGEPVKLVAIATKNGKTYTFTEEIIIKPNVNINISLRETTDQDLAQLFDLN